MISLSHRPAEKNDFKRLTRGHGSLAGNLLKVAIPGSVVAGAFVYLAFHSWLAAVIVGVGLLAASAVSNVSFFRGVRRRQTAGDPNTVEIITVEATRVLDVEHLGSNGPAFCIFAGDGKALLLIGQWLNDYRSFPCLSFRLHRWTDTKKPIAIETTGKRVTPELTKVRLRPSYRLGDVEIFDATPETLQVDLDRQFDIPRH